ncbi:MAG: arylsulfatase [Chthoniobacteraceae bacterium]
MRPFLLLFLFVIVARAAERPPNLIFILADDLGYGQLGSFGAKKIATPNLDRLAAEGMKFTQFYAGSTVCAPSRSVLMTGLHTGHTRVRGNAGKQNRTPQNLRAEDVTVAEVLKKAGYATALIGKWGIGHEGSDGLPNKKGFDYFYGYLDQHHAHNPYPEFIVRNASHVPLRNKTIPGSGGAGEAEGAGIAEKPLDFVPDLMTGEALAWVEQQKAKPFFLYWSLICPHANNEGTKHGRGQEIPDLGPYAEKDWPLPEKQLAATITRLDADVGSLLALLKKLGLDENTLVMFSSDNGPHKEGGNDPEFFDANGPLAGLKRSLTDGGIRVPTVARWPGRVAAGMEIKTPLWFADILPTFAELAGAPIPAKLDGVSFAAALRGKSDAWPKARTLYWEFHENGFSQAVLMDGRWKAIRLKRPDAPIALYDLAGDIGESKDLAAGKPDLVERARALFTSERTESEDWPIKPGR